MGAHIVCESSEILVRYQDCEIRSSEKLAASENARAVVLPEALPPTLGGTAAFQI